MGKHDMPTLEFTVERGRLIPAGPYEAEVLDTYRPGSKLTITLHQKRSLPLLKKYWAVMRDVVDQCKTPWNSPDEASDAIKLALGVTDIGKTVKGQWFIRPGSIAFTSMDEAAFREYFEKAMAILAEVTGIDPAELRQRYSRIAEADNSQSSDTPADEHGSDDAPSPEQDVAAGQSEPADEADEEEDAPASEQEKPSNGSAAASSSEPISGMKRMLCEELVENMLRDAFSEPAIERPAKIDKLRDVFLDEQNLGDLPDFVNLCHETARRVIGKPSEKARAHEYLMGRIPA